MAPTRVRLLAPALWTALALFLGIEAYLALIACGVSIFSYQLRNCPAPVPEQAAPAASLDDILRRIRQAEARLTERPACRAGDATPLQVPAELRQAPGTGPAAAPPSPDAPQGPVAPRHPASSACTEPRSEQTATIVVLDGSRSMLEPYDMDPARDRDMHSRMDSGPEEQRKAAEQEFERATAGSSGRRIDAARDAAAEVLEGAGGTVGAVVFETCSVIETASGPAAAAARVRAVRPQEGTPIAEALRRAASQIPPGANGRHDGNIVLITDGGESCQGDPCAAAKDIKKERPGVVINVVDVAGWTDIGCVATETGGFLRRGGGTIDIRPLVKEAVSRRAAAAASPASRCGGDVETPR
jgi:Mg-chelatase subunit ChlD